MLVSTHVVPAPYTTTTVGSASRDDSHISQTRFTNVGSSLHDTQPTFKSHLRQFDFSLTKSFYERGRTK